MQLQKKNNKHVHCYLMHSLHNIILQQLTATCDSYDNSGKRNERRFVNLITQCNTQLKSDN